MAKLEQEAQMLLW